MLKALILGCALACAAASEASAQLVSLPAQPAGVAWSTADWPEAPLNAAVDRATFDLAITEAFAGPHPQLGETRALLIVQGGAIVFERYGEGYSRESRLVSWSMAKSITHALVGAAVLQGRVHVDEPMGSPHWRAGDRRASIPWRVWLTMTDGLDYQESAANVAHAGNARMLFGEGRRDVAAWAAGRPLIRDPGAHWNYSSAGALLISDALTRAIVPDPRDVADRRSRMRAWMDEALFAPLGMRPVVEFDPRGTFYGSSLIYATARDYARFGALYLRDGVWDGVRLLPEGWVDFGRSRGPDPNTDIYGAHWWLTPTHGTGSPERSLITDLSMSDAFSAQGHEGQVILIVPSKDLIIVRLGLITDTQENWDALGDWLGRVAGSF